MMLAHFDSSTLFSLLLVLEELFMGIPWQVWKLAVIVLLLSVFTVKYLVPHALKFIDFSVLKIHKER